MVLLLLPYPAFAERPAAPTLPSAPEKSPPEENRVVLTIGENATRSGPRYDENLGMWQYLADQVGVDIQYVFLTDEEYAARLASGDLPDIVATSKNLSRILDNGVALDADPYLKEYCPNLLKGDARVTYDVFKKLGNDGDGFYFCCIRI